MQGTITMAGLPRCKIVKRAGGEIRCPDRPERIPFDAADLISLKIDDALGREVAFDLINGKAVAIRPVRLMKGMA
jgi:hypothetical protein